MRFWKGYVRLKLDSESRGNSSHFASLEVLGFSGTLSGIPRVREYVLYTGVGSSRQGMTGTDQVAELFVFLLGVCGPFHMLSCPAFPYSYCSISP